VVVVVATITRKSSLAVMARSTWSRPGALPVAAAAGSSEWAVIDAAL